ncbi:hypothetical protein AWP60_09875 [Escherichia coli]|nr:hypothetical protein AWP60_09875 [Escherichia coli]
MAVVWGVKLLKAETNAKLPDALRLSGLQHIMQHFELARFCRPDKAFTPHPAFCARGWLYH